MQKLLELPSHVHAVWLNHWCKDCKSLSVYAVKLRRSFVVSTPETYPLNQIYKSNKAALSGARNHVRCEWKAREEERPCIVQQSFENAQRGSIDHFDREYILRDGKSHREGCSRPEQSKITLAQLEVISWIVSFHWSLKKFHLWQVKAAVEYVVGQYEVAAKLATLERKDIK